MGGAFAADDRLTPGASVLAMLALVGVPMGGLLLYSLAQTARHHRRARAETPRDTLRGVSDGPVALRGVIEGHAAAPGGVAPVVQGFVRQARRQGRHNGAPRVEWHEVDREIVAHGFILVLDDGSRVGVETDRVELHHPLTRTVQDGDDARARVAEVTPGTRVQVTGLVSGVVAERPITPYRSSVDLPKVSAPRRGALVIATEPPASYHEEQASHHLTWALWGVLSMLFVTVIVTPTYSLLALTGETVWATPTHTASWTETTSVGKQRTSVSTTRHAVMATVPRGVVDQVMFDDETNFEVYGKVNSGAPWLVPFQVSKVSPRVHQIGLAPHVSGYRVVVIVMVTIIFCAGFFLDSARWVPWYRRRRLVEKD